MAVSHLSIVGNIPDLSGYEASGADLCPDYWTPSEVGESKRLVFVGIEMRAVPSQDDPNITVDLECAVFIEPGDPHIVLANGSKRLVGVFENSKVESGTPVEVTYRGKKKNKNNAHQSDTWSVVPLKEKGGK